MNEEEKKAVEYLKTRLYGNESCKYIDVAQEDLRIFINLVNRKEKDIKGWKKYCEEIEEDQTEMSNKNCELEFEVEKLQEENKEKDKIIDLLIKELYTKAHISTRCYLQTSTEECMKYKNCYECLKKHFENKERRNNGKGN